MSETDVKVDFGSMKPPSQEKYISTAGIWRGMTIKSFGIAPFKLKDATKPESATNKKTGGWLEVVFENEKDGKFTMRYFPLPKNELEVKYVGKVYGEKGEELRDKTKAEQLKDDYESFAYLLVQFAMALGHDYNNAIRIVSGGVQTFEGMVDGFKAAFLTKLPTADKVDIKTIWQNSTANRTSFLQMPKAGYRNIVIARYDPAAMKSTLEFTQYENQKCKVEMYPYQKTATAGAAGSTPPPAGAVDNGAAAQYNLPATANGDLF